MSVNYDNEFGIVTFTCDGKKGKCNEEFIHEGFDGRCDVGTAAKAARTEGWKISKDEADEWYHLCPDCKEKE